MMLLAKTARMILPLLLALSLVPGSLSCSASYCSFTLTGGTTQPVDIFLLGSSGDGRAIYSQKINYMDGLGSEETIRFGKTSISPSKAGTAYTLRVFVYPQGAFKSNPANFLFVSPESVTYQS
jgi:hypothetical protein